MRFVIRLRCRSVAAESASTSFHVPGREAPCTTIGPGFGGFGYLNGGFIGWIRHGIVLYFGKSVYLVEVVRMAPMAACELTCR